MPFHLMQAVAQQVDLLPAMQPYIPVQLKHQSKVGNNSRKFYLVREYFQVFLNTDQMEHHKG